MLVLSINKTLINVIRYIIRLITMVSHKVNCETCQHQQHKKHHAHYERNQYGYREFVPTYETYYCPKQLRYTQTLLKYCKDYLSKDQTTLKEGRTDMVKIGEIPTEAGRVELNELPQVVALIATEERVVQPSQGKSGGLIITFKLRDGRTFPQKYTKVSGALLVEAMKKLKIKETEDLQKAWYIYKLTVMRIGLPRMIPFAKDKGK